MLTRREFGAVVGGTLASAATPLAAQRGGATGPVLDIADWSYWWYGVERARLARGTVVDGTQMFVEHWIPRDVRHPYPVVLIHGGFQQGSDWLSTPQGNRGWVSALLARGYAVYVLDRPGQGRNPYQPFVHGLFDAQAPTFERVAEEMKLGVNDPSVAQSIASMNQPMANNAATQALWKSRARSLTTSARQFHQLRRRRGTARLTSGARRRKRDSPSTDARPRTHDCVERGVITTRPANSTRPRTRTPNLKPCRRAASGSASARRCPTADRAGRCSCSMPSRAAASAPVIPVHAAARRHARRPGWRPAAHYCAGRLRGTGWTSGCGRSPTTPMRSVRVI
jgi:hypothetical protein